MKKFLFCILLFCSLISAAVVCPAQSSLTILLDASGLCDESSSVASSTTEFLTKYAVGGNSGAIYCRSYDASMMPAEAAVSLFQGTNSVFNQAIKKWSEGKGPALEEIPGRFVIIAEGVAGLAVREYIQSNAPGRN